MAKVTRRVMDLVTYNRALLVRGAQRRYYIQRMYGMDWVDGGAGVKVDAVQVAIVGIVMRGWY